MSKLSAVSTSPMLREYAQGAAQSAAAPIAEFIAPGVDVPTSRGRFSRYNEKNRFRLPDTLRAVNGKAVVVKFDREDAEYNCQPNALDYPVDDLEQNEAAGMEDLLQEGAQAIAEIAALKHEKTVIDKALTAAGGGTDYNFTSDSVDPIALLDAAIKAVVKAARYGSLMGVGLVFGCTAWERTKNNTKVKGRYIVGTGKGGSVGQVAPTIDDFGGLLLATPECRVAMMVEDTAPEGKDATIEFLMDEAILIFARIKTPTRRDPSFMKTFRLKGRYMVPGVYETEDGRGTVAKFDWSEDVQVTNSAAVIRLNAKNS